MSDTNGIPQKLLDGLAQHRKDIHDLLAAFSYDEEKIPTTIVKHPHDPSRNLGYYLKCADDNAPCIFFIHGGGFAIGEAIQWAPRWSAVAQLAGCNLFMSEYGLTPEYKFPQNVIDCVEGYKYLIETRNISADRIAVAGESAGGGMVALLLNALQGPGKDHPENPFNKYFTTDKALPLPRAGLMISPWYDLNSSFPSYQTNNKCPVLLDFFRSYFHEITPYFTNYGESLKMAQPLGVNPKGFPPVTISVGNIESLVDECVYFTKKCGMAGVDADLKIYHDLPHNGLNPLEDDETQKLCDAFFDDQVAWFKRVFTKAKL